MGEASFFKYHPVVEAHVRAYAVLHEKTNSHATRGKAGAATEHALFQTRTVRLTSPNDELGGVLFLATPQLVSHRIDRWSPFFPPHAFTKPPHHDRRAPASGSPAAGGGLDGDALARATAWLRSRPTFPGLLLREDDVDASEMVEAAVEGRRAAQESGEGTEKPGAERPVARGHMPSRGTGEPPPRQGFGAEQESLRAMRDAIQQHVRNSELELIVLVEAIDPFSSNTFQAVHSYMGDDFAFDLGFAPTMSISAEGHASLAWEQFHEMVDVPFNSRQIVASSHA